MRQNSPGDQLRPTVAGDRPECEPLSEDEAWELYVRCARDELGLTPDEFEQAWARGDFEEGPGHSAGVGVWMVRASRPARPA
ncbi:MAG: hypothetical protein C0506_04525 [Anaerolinea sp.]|nr:hypothetical protein [Anaerolinea sp.]